TLDREQFEPAFHSPSIAVRATRVHDGIRTAGDESARADRARAGGGTARLRLRVDRGSVGHRCGDSALLARRDDVDDQGRHGDQYDIPYTGPNATGLGKPLKLMARPLRPEIPIYLAALSPKNVRLAFEIADGWLPIFFSPERARDVFGYEEREGFEIAPTVHV